VISLGQTAHDTYRRLLNSVPPPWENLPGDVQVAWEKTASAVAITTHQPRLSARFGDGKTRHFLFYHHQESNDFTVVLTPPVEPEAVVKLTPNMLVIHFREGDIPGAGDQQYTVELRMNKHAENPEILDRLPEG
jgi:hypothetical protein